MFKPQELHAPPLTSFIFPPALLIKESVTFLYHQPWLISTGVCNVCWGKRSVLRWQRCIMFAYPYVAALFTHMPQPHGIAPWGYSCSMCGFATLWITTNTVTSTCLEASTETPAHPHEIVFLPRSWNTRNPSLPIQETNLFLLSASSSLWLASASQTWKIFWQNPKNW